MQISVYCSDAPATQHSSQDGGRFPKLGSSWERNKINAHPHPDIGGPHRISPPPQTAHSLDIGGANWLNVQLAKALTLNQSLPSIGVWGVHAPEMRPGQASENHLQ